MSQVMSFPVKLTGIIVISFWAHSVFSQQEGLSILRGTVKSGETSLGYATIYLKNTNLHTSADESGSFIFRVPAGTCILCVRYIGHETFEQTIQVKPHEERILHIQMKESNQLDEVIVEGKTPVKRINESAYNVTAIDAKALRSTNLDIVHVLDKVTGIKIREEGGVGSSAQINLNGFTGRHVKIFMDGIPLDGSGDGLPINSIPLGVAERIEVYKGVVPVELGADALGGAINIVTEKSTNTFLDASYLYGSFNTHKSSLSFGHTLKNGISMNLNAYQNYSDNDYKVKVNEYLDVNSAQYINETRWFKRFHDRYHNEVITAKAGVVNKPWADRLMLGLMYSQEHMQIQNGNIMTIVFGGKERNTRNLSPSAEYEKRNLLTRNLNVSLSARYDRNRINNTDTLAREYSWTSEYRSKSSQGEADKTIGKSTDKSGYITANINYSIAGRHFFSLNNMFSDFRRTEMNETVSMDNPDRTSQKNISGLSYKYTPGRKWNILAFAKYYYTYGKGPVDTSRNASGRYAMRTNDYSLTGYGAAATYSLKENLQFKLSFEKTYRLPTPKELFGDGSLEKGNADINPENSRNLNFNVSFSHLWYKDHTITIDAGFVYRNTQDFIKREIDNKGYGGSVNLKKVLNVGGELEVRYFYKSRCSLGVNLSYQNMRNKEKVPAGDPKSNIYNDRIPNIPYLFGNADAGYSLPGLFGKGHTLSFGYNLCYVHQFYKEWQNEGGTISIPGQLSHDINMTYSVKDGRYNLAFEVRNFTNELLYDNFYLQKPGRSFFLKIRYFFFKRNKIN